MKRPRRTRKSSFTPQVVRDWQGGDTPFDTEENLSAAGAFIDEILSSFKLSEGVDEDRIRQGWQAVAGDFIASQTQVVSLRKGVLLLRVIQPAMRFHLEQNRADLLRKIQSELGAGFVKEVKLTTG